MADVAGGKRSPERADEETDRARGDRRYATLAALVVVQARSRRGDTVDLADAERLLGDLDVVAGPEA